MGGAATRSGRRSRRRVLDTSTAPDVGLVVAAAMAPGTFAPSLSQRSVLDQGLVSGLATGLHYLLAAGAQDAVEATARFLTDGVGPPGVSPARKRAATIAVDCAAVPLGLAVLRALPPRADDPLRGAVRQAAWRLGATGLGGALLSGAQAGVHTLDDRLRLRGDASHRSPWRPPSASPSPTSSTGCGPASTPSTPSTRTAGPLPRPCSLSPSRRGSSAASPASPTARTSSPTSPPAGWPHCSPVRLSCGDWPATRVSLPGWGWGPPRSGTGRCAGSRR